MGVNLGTRPKKREIKLGLAVKITVRFAWVLVLSSSVQAARLSDSYSGRKVLINYLAGMAQHVTWPTQVFIDATAPIVICVFGEDPFQRGLELMVAGRRVGERDLQVRQLGDNIDAIVLGCHLLFIVATEKPKVKEILTKLDNLSVLTVSDMEGFASVGGMIGFVGSGSKVAMQINRTTLLGGSLDVAPELMRFSR